MEWWQWLLIGASAIALGAIWVTLISLDVRDWDEQPTCRACRHKMPHHYYSERLDREQCWACGLMYDVNHKTGIHSDVWLRTGSIARARDAERKAQRKAAEVKIA